MSWGSSSRQLAVFALAFAILGTIPGPEAHAEEQGEFFLPFEQMMQSMPNLIQVMVGFDSERSRTFSADSDLRLPNEYRLLVGVGSNTSDLEGDELKTGTFRLGISSDPINEYQGTLSFEDWGVKDEVKRQKWSATVARWGQNWNVQGTTTYRQIHLITDHPSVQGVDVEVHSPAVGCSIQYVGWGKWNLRLSGEKYWYAADPSALLDSRINQFFSAETLTLSSSFLKYNGALELGYQFKKLYFGVEGSQNKSAIDNTKSVTGTLLFSIDLPKGIGLQLQGGRTLFPDAPESSDVTFAQAGFSFSWSQ
ncbi:MAG: hypothetical protein KDD43_00515 [Bdellovibrionales bacterium]|nr:hypothetical protein [Bdellovibrionales bacterium]